MNIKIDWLILDYYHGCYVPWQQEKASRQLPAKKLALQIFKSITPKGT